MRAVEDGEILYRKNTKGRRVFPLGPGSPLLPRHDEVMLRMNVGVRDDRMGSTPCARA